MAEYRNTHMAKQEDRLCWVPKFQKTSKLQSPQILDKLGTDFCMLSKDEWCCASALVRTGQRDLMKEYAVHNIDAIKDRGAKTVLFACAGCLRAATIDWPRWYEGNITFKTMPLSEYQREKIKSNEVEWKRLLDLTVTYHDPFHNGRHLMHIKGKDLGLRGSP